MFEQLGFGLTVLEPGEPMTMYHWETDQEDFLVLSGEAVAVVRRLASVARTQYYTPLEDVVEATRYVETGQKTGNVLLLDDAARSRAR